MAQDANQMTPEQALKTALARLNEGRIAQAEELARAVLAERRDWPDALQVMGLIKRRVGDLEDAEALLLRCVEMSPANLHYRNNYGLLLKSLGRLQEAVAQFQAALAVQPEALAPRLNLARTLAELGQGAKAEVEARRLLEATPKEPQAWSVLGAALSAQERHIEACSAYAQALELRPDYAMARLHRGSALVEAGRPAEALQELETAQSQGVDTWRCEADRARALLGLGRVAQAEAALSRAVGFEPFKLETQRRLADLRWRRGDEDFASDLLAAAAANPNVIGVQLGYGQVLADAGEPDQARQWIERAADPEMPAVQAFLARLASEAGDIDEAVRLASAAHAADPMDLEWALSLAGALVAQGSVNRAQSLLEPVREAHPNDQGALALQLTAMRIAGDPQFAEWANPQAVARVSRPPAPKDWAQDDAYMRDLGKELAATWQGQARRPLESPLRGGVQSARDLTLEEGPAIKAWFTLAHAAVRDYLAALPPPRGAHPLLVRKTSGHRIVRARAWRIDGGGHIRDHVDSRGWISGLYIVRAPSVALTGDRAGGVALGAPYPASKALGDPVQLWVEPKPGALVLAPSYVWKGVRAFPGAETMQVIAFEVAPQ